VARVYECNVVQGKVCDMGHVSIEVKWFLGLVFRLSSSVNNNGSEGLSCTSLSVSLVFHCRH